jgi:hypothetical protein
MSKEGNMNVRLLGIQLVIVCVVLFGVLCWAQEPSGPSMVLDETDFDAGQVIQGELIKHAFTVQNSGDQALEIHKVNPG